MSAQSFSHSNFSRVHWRAFAVDLSNYADLSERRPRFGFRLSPIMEKMGLRNQSGVGTAFCRPSPRSPFECGGGAGPSYPLLCCGFVNNQVENRQLTRIDANERANFPPFLFYSPVLRCIRG